MNEIYEYRQKLKVYTSQKIGRTNYFIISQYNGSENIIEKLGDMMAEAYERQSDVLKNSSKQSGDCA